MTAITYRVYAGASTHYFYQAASEQALRSTLSESQFWQQHGNSITVEPVLGDRPGILGEVMNSMPEPWRYRWCGGGMCGCMGCSNVSGSLRALGFSMEEWQAWVDKNPDPRPPVDHEAMREQLIRALSTKH